jgi:hypothetical protein
MPAFAIHAFGGIDAKAVGAAKSTPSARNRKPEHG